MRETVRGSRGTQPASVITLRAAIAQDKWIVQPSPTAPVKWIIRPAATLNVTEPHAQKGQNALEIQERTEVVVLVEPEATAAVVMAVVALGAVVALEVAEVAGK